MVKKVTFLCGKLSSLAVVKFELGDLLFHEILILKINVNVCV